MEHLFSTNLNVNNKPVAYHIVFDQERYQFNSDGGQALFPSFSFRREHDLWVDEQKLPDELKKQAIDALEKYLLKQH